MVNGRTLYKWAVIEPGCVENMTKMELAELWEHLAKIPLHERGTTHRAIVGVVEAKMSHSFR